MRGRSPHESPAPRRRSCSSGRDGKPTSLLVRNISRDTRPEDLRGPFERFGPVKDVYLPKDYYTGEPRGFGFIQFMEPQDAIEAQYRMDNELIKGRQVTVVFAEENRKKPSEMKLKESRSRSDYSYKRSPLRGRSRSRTPRSRSPRSPRYYSVSPRRRNYSRSYSPQERRSYYRSPRRSRENYYSGPSPGPYRREQQMPLHGHAMPPYMHPAAMARFDMFSGGHHHGMFPMYPPYHHSLSGANRGWDL